MLVQRSSSSALSFSRTFSALIYTQMYTLRDYGHHPTSVFGDHVQDSTYGVPDFLRTT